MDRKEYHREYMKKWRAGEKTAVDNGLSNLIEELEWVDIPSAPGYKASKCGHILSSGRTMTRSNGRKHTVPARVLKVSTDTSGYNQFRSKQPPQGKMFLVHRAVYEAWHGEIPEDHDIDHIDGDPLNNRLDNLQAMARMDHANKTLALIKQKAYQAGHKAGWDDGYAEGWEEGHAQGQGM